MCTLLWLSDCWSGWDNCPYRFGISQDIELPPMKQASNPMRKHLVPPILGFHYNPHFFIQTFFNYYLPQYYIMLSLGAMEKNECDPSLQRTHHTTIEKNAPMSAIPLPCEPEQYNRPGLARLFYHRSWHANSTPSPDCLSLLSLFLTLWLDETKLTSNNIPRDVFSWQL